MEKPTRVQQLKMIHLMLKDPYEYSHLYERLSHFWDKDIKKYAEYKNLPRVLFKMHKEDYDGGIYSPDIPSKENYEQTIKEIAQKYNYKGKLK